MDSRLEFVKTTGFLLPLTDLNATRNKCVVFQIHIVSDLINQNTSEWDLRLHQYIFPPSQIQEILTIPISLIKEDQMFCFMKCFNKILDTFH